MKPLLLSLLIATAAQAVDYKSQIVPIFRAKCYECHSETKGKVKGDLAMEPDARLAEHIGPGRHVIPGEPAKSTMLIFCQLPDDDEDVMPPKGKNRLTPPELALLEGWIKEGASLTAGAAATPASAPTVPMASTAAAQTWTSSDGRTVEASFVSLEGESVQLRVTATGMVHRFPLSRLSPESQAQARAAAAR
jgi:hypothetical protein